MPIDLHQSPNWKEYEDLVCDALRQENPELIIERNIHIAGHLSNQRRQIDIALRGQMAGHDVLAVVDCKRYSRKIDVNDDRLCLTLGDGVQKKWYRHDLSDSVYFSIGDSEYFRENSEFVSSLLNNRQCELSFDNASMVDYVIDVVRSRSNQQ